MGNSPFQEDRLSEPSDEPHSNLLLTLTCRAEAADPFVASDLGYLVHKHPQKLQTSSVNFGQVHVFTRK